MQRPLCLWRFTARQPLYSMKTDYKAHFKKKYETSKTRVHSIKRKRFKASVIASVCAVMVGFAMLVNYGDTHNAANGTLNKIDLPTPSASNIARDNKDSADLIPWQDAVVQSGDSLSVIADREGIPASNIHTMMQSGDAVKQLRYIMPKQVIRYKLNDDGQLAALEYDVDHTQRLEIKRLKNGEYSSQIIQRTFDTIQTRVSGVIKSSMYQAALDAGLSDNLIMELANIFGYDIDFTLDVRKGDSFHVIWEEKHRNGAKFRDGNILAASFINQDRVITALRYTDENGDSNYFTPKGNSMKKAFLRSPVHFTRISSRFNPSRLHPIYKTKRPHRGVDYAARTGTPVYSSGDGKIIFRGKKRGYGNVVIVKHGHKYTTLYAHLSRFNRKASNGSRVKQGQTIGYVGQTGWATGPHLHYEFRVNGVHRNPLTVKLPTAKPLNKQYKFDFERKSTPLLAQLDTLRRAQKVLVASQTAQPSTPE